MRSVLISTITALAGVALAQPDPPVSFEVASVRAAAPLAGREAQMALVLRPFPTVTGGRLQARACSLVSLIAFAYRVKPDHVSGPGWLEEELFDVAAKLPEGASKDDAPGMVRSLLAERFGLEAHTVEKVVAIYALRVQPKGAKLELAEAADPARAGCRTGQCAGYKCEKVTMSVLARNMSQPSWQRRAGLDGLPVVDFTELTGVYNFDLPLAWVATPSPRIEMAEECRVPGPSVYAALNGLGLSLTREKQPQSFVVVDRVSRTPTGN